MLKSIINTLNNIVYTVQKYIHLHEHAHIQTKSRTSNLTVTPYKTFNKSNLLYISCMTEHILIKLFKILYMYMYI